MVVGTVEATMEEAGTVIQYKEPYPVSSFKEVSLNRHGGWWAGEA
jgi:hypothetical protein